LRYATLERGLMMPDLTLPELDWWFRLLIWVAVFAVALLLAILYERKERKRAEEDNSEEETATAISEKTQVQLQEKEKTVEKICRDYFEDGEAIKKDVEKIISKIMNNELENLVKEKVQNKINVYINKSFRNGATMKLLNDQIEEKLEKVSEGMVDKIYMEDQQTIKENIKEAIKHRLSTTIQKRTTLKIFNHIDKVIDEEISKNHKEITFNIIGEFDKEINDRYLQKYVEKVANDKKNYMPVKLSEKEKEILKMRFGLDNKEIKTLEELGMEIGCTRERVRQHQKNAIQKLINIYKNNNNQSSINAGDQLTEIEKKILKMRSGLAGKKIMSIPMVKDETDCTREQILQHYKNAIQKLLNTQVLQFVFLLNIMMQF